MKHLIHLLIFGAVFSGTVLLGLPSAYAEKMSAQTQDLVIEKMERVLSTMEKTDASWIPSQQRLADLLSERARWRFMQEVEANCHECKGSKADRLKAVKIYETLLQNVKLNDHGPILFQLAHLHTMASQPEQAIQLFERIIKEAKAKKISAEIVARSHSGLGDLLFQKGKFQEALNHYTLALKYPGLQGRGLVIYNMAWSEFNMDRLNAGISRLEKLLQSPELIVRESAEGSKYDPVFHFDIVRDLATFYARRPITNKELTNYEAFSPQEKRTDLLLHFASEADRLGQKKAAAIIYNRYLEDKSLTDEERLEAFVKLAMVNYDLGDTNKSTEDFAKAAQEFQKNCKVPEKCKDLEKTMKRYVTELHRSKKVKPDVSLLNSYIIYNKTFPQDAEMAQRGSQVADELGRYAIAIQFLRTVSTNSSASEKDRENALNAEISIAEKSKNPDLQRSAYRHYLATSPKGPKKFEVRYQMAYLEYQQKNLAEASPAFHELALDKTGKPDLRKKSADLSLDGLAQLKRDDTLEDWAWEYSVVFPQSRVEFENIARKALLNRSARVANDSSSSSSDMKRTLGQMQKANMKGASASDMAIFHTNRSVLAKKVGEDEIYVQSLQALIASSAVSEARREESLANLVAYHEKKLEFKNAYQVALKMKFSKVSLKDKELRLGTLADLASLNPTRHYQASLDAGLKGPSSRSVRARLVVLSSNPVRELRDQASELARDPSLLNEMTLLVYARTGDKKGLAPVLARRELRRQTAPGFVAKQDFYSEVESFRGRITRHQLQSQNDFQLQRTIKERVQLLKRADQTLAKSLKLKDVTAQLMALNIVAVENGRMVRDLVALPMPPKLTPAEQKQYLDLLKQKSKPYLVKSKMAQQKESEIWEKSPALAQLLKDYRSVRPELKKLLRREMQLLTQLPNDSRRHDQIQSSLNEENTVSLEDLNSARKSVAENPESVRDLEKLKELETKIGHPLMGTYLEARLSRIQRGRSL